MNVISPSGDVLHHHNPLALSIGGMDEDDLDSTVLDDEGRPRSRPSRGQSRIEFERLAAFFHVPINEAAKGLGVCATVLKKVCRKHGIPRWPHRKIKKLDTMLAMLETAANKPGSTQHDDDVRKKMDAVMRDRAVLMAEGKLADEGKTESKRSKADGKGRKRKKADDEDDDDVDANSSHDSLNGSYSLSHSYSEDILQNQMVIAPPINNMNHISAMDLNMGYHIGPYAGGYQMLGYPIAGGVSMNQNNMMPNSSYPYNPALLWNGGMGMNGVNLPGVHSISSGIISSTTGMMMHNLPPPLSHSSLPMASPTPISPLTPMAPPLSSQSSHPLPLYNKHPKFAHNDVLLTDHTHHHAYTSPYPYHQPTRIHSSPHLAYSEYSVQHDTHETSPHSFRLFGQEVQMHPTNSSE